MHMPCASLHPFLADSLSASEAAAFRAHLLDCTACQREAATTMQIDALVQTNADKERIRETLRPLLRVACRRAVNRPGEIDKAVNDTLSGEGETLVAAMAASEAARVAAEERARVLGGALREAADAIDSAADAIEGLDGGDIDGECQENRKFAKKLRALASLPAAPAEKPAPVCLARSGAPEHGGCGGCSGGECGCQCRASAPAEVARVRPVEPQNRQMREGDQPARVTPAVEDHGAIVSRSSAHFNVLVGGPSGIVHSIHESRLPGATVGDAVTVTVRKG